MSSEIFIIWIKSAGVDLPGKEEASILFYRYKKGIEPANFNFFN